MKMIMKDIERKRGRWRKKERGGVGTGDRVREAGEGGGEERIRQTDRPTDIQIVHRRCIEFSTCANLLSSLRERIHYPT